MEKKFYTQCWLERPTAKGGKLVSMVWIPDELARVGKKVKISCERTEGCSITQAEESNVWTVRRRFSRRPARDLIGVNVRWRDFGHSIR